jgi:hypothetical protein
MPVYDCGDPDCDECRRAFPDRDQAIARYLAREEAYAKIPQPKVNAVTDLEIKTLASTLRFAARQESKPDPSLLQEAADALIFMVDQRRRSKEKFDEISAGCREILHGEL